ncbi:MAG: MMPL family transporter, partial [Actinobacteria bacterium]|nr:MMPL family transporter [Actinomycetota bacterium]
MTDLGVEKKRVRTGRKAIWVAIVTIIAWLAIGGFSGQAFSKISNVQENDNSAFLPQNAESTQASKITVKFSAQDSNVLPTLLLLVGDINPQTNAERFAAVNTFAAELGQKVLPESGKPLSTYFAPGIPLQAIPAPDGKAALINVQLNTDVAAENINNEPALPLIVEFIREEMKKSFESQSIESYVTGPGGIFADL